MNPESRPGYVRLHNHSTKIESMLKALRKQKYDESKNFILIPQDFDVIEAFTPFRGVEQRGSLLFDLGKVLQSGKNIT